MRSRLIIALGVSATLTGIFVLAVLQPKTPQTVSQNGNSAPTPPGDPMELPPESQDSVETTNALAGKPRDCTPEVRYLGNDDGTSTPVIVCEREGEEVRHEYESYSTEALNALAWADAKAAEVLGMRLRDTDEAVSLSLILRAAALAGGDPAPILYYAQTYPQPVSIDGTLVRKTVHTRYVLGAVAEMLGAGPNLLPYWEAQIRQVSTDPQREIEMLRERARELVDEMRQIELDVTGESTFGGRGDA